MAGVRASSNQSAAIAACSGLSEVEDDEMA